MKEPLYIEESCEEIWKFIPDKYEITKGYLIAMITNKGKVLIILLLLFC